jgi:hypothetical protein
MNCERLQTSTASAPDAFGVGVEAASRCSAARALALARATGTPCFVWQDGRIVDIATANNADAAQPKVPGWD